MNEQQQWFQESCKSPLYDFLKKKPIAYFSVEYALSDALPTYAGGLGILAGDYIRELADQKIPAIAIGLMYHQPYGISGKQVENIPAKQTNKNDLVTVTDTQNTPLLVHIPIQDHNVAAKVWLWEKKTIPVYLLDTDIPENSPADREITRRLYDADKEVRLKQEMVLGIGGFRLLEAIGIDPSIIHMNEGHSAMLALELIHHEMKKRKIGFQEAASLSGHHVVFTNHTLVPAGNEIFSSELFTLLLNEYASSIEVPVTEIMSLGAIEDSQNVSTTLLALHVAGRSNAVSQLHAKIAKNVWPSYSFESVTNGIHIPTWDQTPVSLETNHKENKQKLLSYIKKQTGLEWQENHLLLGWARRMVPYKRPFALFEEIEGLKRLASDPNKPIRIVVAGIAPPNHQEASELLESVKIVIQKEFPDVSVYLPHYNMEIAKLLTSGCDVLLNTPVVGSEACGTSGMKAGINGVLPCTTKDGWVDEVDLTNIGWYLNNDKLHESLITTLAETIIPLYYTDKNKWGNLMQNARALILNQFSTTRMLHEYFERMYLPIITSSYAHYFS
jgi:glycogen phosphorylase